MVRKYFLDTKKVSRATQFKCTYICNEIIVKANKTKDDEQVLEGTHRKNHDTLMISEILVPKL